VSRDDLTVQNTPQPGHRLLRLTTFFTTSHNLLIFLSQKYESISIWKRLFHYIPITVTHFMIPPAVSTKLAKGYKWHDGRDRKGLNKIQKYFTQTHLTNFHVPAFWFWGFCTACKVNYSTFREPLWVPSSKVISQSSNWPLKMGPAAAPETSSSNLPCTPCKISKTKNQYSFQVKV
jgi:hypothetical protein